MVHKSYKIDKKCMFKPIYFQCSHRERTFDMKVGIYALCSLAKAEVKYDSSYFDSLLEDIYATQMQNRNSAADYAEKLEREIK